MKKRKSSRLSSVISDISIKAKTAVLTATVVIAVVSAVLAMFHAVRISQEEKHKNMQKMIVTASEQLMEMTIESSVAIAKSIYTNENIYNFLNKEYSSSADYYDAFYEFQEKTPLAIAETNIINKYTIYSENPTILNGGKISTFDSELNADWYHAYKKLNKPMILFVDSDDNTVSLIRRLDFQNIRTGESCIKLELNTRIVTDYCKNFNFDGELYIVSGGAIIYSNIEDMTIENTGINQDFESYIKNYYTADIEYYAHETRETARDFFLENIIFIVFIAVILILFVASMVIFSANMTKRMTKATETLRTGGKPDDCGKDELGNLVGVCADISEKLSQRSSESEKTNEKIIQKKSIYNMLFNTAVNLWAGLETARKYPELQSGTAEDIPLADEIRNLSLIGVDVKSDGDIAEINVPACSLVLVCGNLTEDGGKLSAEYKGSEIVFSKETKESPSKVLKINAIFETENIAEEYTFSQDSEYNPYIRLKSRFGGDISAEASDRGGFRLVIKFKNEKSDC